MKKNGFTLTELSICLGFVFLFCSIPVVALWTDASIEWWIFYFKKESVNVPYWLSFIITCVGNGFIVAFNILTEIFKFVL